MSAGAFHGALTVSGSHRGGSSAANELNLAEEGRWVIWRGSVNRDVFRTGRDPAWTEEGGWVKETRRGAFREISTLLVSAAELQTQT